MGRKRTVHHDLPKGMHRKGKALYFVRGREWVALGSKLEAAHARYLDLIGQAKTDGVHGELARIDGMLERKQSITRGPGVYLLLHRKEVVYVGQSRSNVWTRATEHLANKQFTDVLVIQYDDMKMLNLVERALIQRYRPKYNVAYNSPDKHWKKRRIAENILQIPA